MNVNPFNVKLRYRNNDQDMIMELSRFYKNGQIGERKKERKIENSSNSS